MDIYEFAMQMEKDGENYYREVATKTDRMGLKNILTLLADAEVNHYNILEKMKNDEKTHISDKEILHGVKNIFERIRYEKEVQNANVSELELYKKAQEIEKQSEDFYLDNAHKMKDQSHKQILLKIANEEKRHYLILENVIDYVSRPQEWLEDPEWYHLEDY